MKKYVIAFSLVIGLALAIFGASYIGKEIAQEPSLAQQVDPEQKVVAKAGYGQSTSDASESKRDSFTSKKPYGGKADSSDTPEAMVARGKNYLLNQVDNRLKQLQPFKAKIEGMGTLAQADRDSLIAELEGEIGTFKTFKPEISRSTTKDDIKAVAEKIKAEWLKSRVSVDRANGLLLATQENQLISDADAAALGIQKRIDNLKASGKDTKAFEQLLLEYNKKVASAKQDAESASKKSKAAESATTDEEKKKLIQEKEMLAKSANSSIRDAYQLLAKGAREDFQRRFK